MQKYLGLKALAGYLNCATQKEFADKARMTTTSVNMHWWEGGSSRPTLKTIEKIAARVNMPVEEIVSKLYAHRERKS